jgi:predicted permease
MNTDPASRGGIEPRWLRVFGRLAPGSTIEQAEAELDAIRRGYADEHPDDVDVRDRRTTVIPYITSQTEPGTEAMFLGMFVFVLLVLALACASVANLLLVRATSRTEEIAVRAALGAGRRRLVTQLLIEALLLSSAGAVLGVVAAQVGLTWFKGFVEIDRLPFWIELGMSPAAAVFAAIAAFGAAMIAGTVPAIRSTGVDLNGVLKGMQGASSRVRFGSISSALTIAEVTLSIAFLAGAALAAESLLVAGDLDRKLPTKQVLVAEIALVDEVGTDETGKTIVPEGSIPPAQWATVQEAIRVATERLPGARVAVLANSLPGTQHSRSRIELENDAAGNPAAGVRVPVAAVSPEFFEAFDAVLLAGRSFGPADNSESELVAIVNRTFTRRFFGIQNPLGERFRLAPGDAELDWIRIIGVIDDLRMNPGADNKAGFYVPFAQQNANRFTLAVRLDNDPLAMSAAVKETIKRVDSRIDVAGLQTHEQWIEGYLVSYKTMSLMFTALGGAAFFLALAGLYAVMAFSVVQRTREIGIRLALGADRRRVLGVILRRGLLQIFTGIALGSALGWALLQLMQLVPIDMASGGTGWLVVAAASMLVAGLVASLVPASRALGIHPVEALRHE